MKNKLFAEFMGTFILIFIGCGGIIVNDLYEGILGHLGVNLVFGLVVMAIIYSIGNVSGAHINPAVTIGFLVAGRIEKKIVIPYIFVQILGAITGAFVLHLLFPTHTTLGSTLPSGSLLQSFIFEIFLSFILMFIVLNVSTGHKEIGMMAGVAVGGTIVFEALVGGPVSGASMNPARSLGPAVISGNLSPIWIYLTAPVIGTILAHPICQWVQGKNCCDIN